MFNLKFIFQSNFFKIASVRVSFNPGFPLGGGFPAEQLLLQRYSIVVREIKTQRVNLADFFSKVSVQNYIFCVAGAATQCDSGFIANGP
jgi:hypothetical protein